MPDQDPFGDVITSIAKLRANAAAWHAQSPDPADFMPAFAGAADPIIEAAERIGGDAIDAAHMLIDEILIELGYMDPAERQT